MRVVPLVLATFAATGVCVPSAAADVSIVRGFATLTSRDPVEGAHVSIQSMSGRPIPVLGGRHAARAVTNENGAFSPRVRNLPRRYVIVVRGGTADGRPLPIRLREASRRTRLGIADVNLVTTFVAARLRAHPKESQATAHERVRRLLGIPHWHKLNYGVSASSRYFDGDRFLVRAARNGGLQRYFRRLLLRLDDESSRLPSFGAKGLRARAAQESSFVSKLLGGLGTGILGAAGGSLYGAVLTNFGQGQGAQLNDIQDELTTLQTNMRSLNEQLSDVESLEGSLQAQIAQGDYTTHATLIRNDAVNLAQSIWHDMRFIVQNPDDRGNASLSKTLLGEIEASILDQDFTIPNAMTPAAGETPLLDDVQGALFQGLGTPIVVGDQLSGPANDIYQYWASWHAILITEKVEYENSTGASKAYVIGLRDRAKRQIDTWSDRLQPVVPDGIAVDTRSRVMWTVPRTPTKAKCGTGWPTSAQHLWTASQVQFHAPSKDSPIYPCGNNSPSVLPVSTGGFSDWSLPLASDISALYASDATTSFVGFADSKAASLNAWFTGALTSAVFPDLSGLAARPASPTNSFTRDEWNGTLWSVWTKSCIYDGTVRVASVGDEATNGTTVSALTYCNALRLRDGAFVNECVADDWPAHLGCDTPLETDVYDGLITQHECACTTVTPLNHKTNQRFDYFHDNIVLARRALLPDETYWLDVAQ